MNRRHRHVLIAVAVAHCFLTVLFNLWTMGWSMVILDGFDTDKSVPLKLEMVGTTAFLFNLPILYPLARLLLHFGFGDPTSLPYWFLPPLNSALVTWAIVLLVRWRQSRRVP